MEEKSLLEAIAVANVSFRNKEYKNASSFYLDILRKRPEAYPKVKVQLLHAHKFLGIYTVTSEFTLTLREYGVNVDDILKHELFHQIRSDFDVDFYLNSYKDVASAKVDAFDHYLEWGRKELRRPNSRFCPIYYSNVYEDVSVAGIDPYFHYLKFGKVIGRQGVGLELPNLHEDLVSQIPKIKLDNIDDGAIEFKDNGCQSLDLKLIAFYLPQFHPFQENDEWWGKGFTEWYNVAKAQPNFEGHYQPHYPIHSGYYDLRVPSVLKEQAKLAKNYGVHGFNFYYYWFDGKILMHEPFDILLEHKDIDINFCITWANENWTRRWDGAENDILIAQNHCDEDSEAFIKHMFKYFSDDRYIRIDNKPVLIVYRSNIIPNMRETVEIWRELAVTNGFDGLYIIGAQTFGFRDPNEYGFDAAMEFPPHTVKSGSFSNKVNITNPNFTGQIFNYEEVVDNAVKEKEPDYKKFPTAMLSWDNTARKQNNSHTFANFSLVKYKQWLNNAATNVFYNEKYADDEKLMFVNAWNEWAEGTHLEPDRERGYGYLQATYDVVKNFKRSETYELNKKDIDKKSNFAIVLHIHYSDVWQDIEDALTSISTLAPDLYVTITEVNEDLINKILEFHPGANIDYVENRGRDILPFINTYKKIKDLGYKFVLKMHSKKSTYRTDGDTLRGEIFSSLTGKDMVDILLNGDQEDKNVGVLCPSKFIVKHSSKNMTFDKPIVLALCSYLGIDFKFGKFPAGSMYWFKPEALSGIEKIEPDSFESEYGLADGTVPHAIERIICSISEKNGFSTVAI